MFKNPESAKQFQSLNAELKQLVEEALEQRQYRRAYNQRPEVRNKRKAYNKTRNALIKQLLAQHEAEEEA